MIEILIADDHTIFRDGLKQILAEETDIAVRGEAVDGEDTLSRVRSRHWDVLVLDMSMPGRNGIALIGQIRRIRPELPILVLSMHTQHQYAVQAIKAGASGYVTKNSPSAQLVDGIRKVARGGMFVSEVVAEKLAMQLRRPEAQAPHTRLTGREFQIFHMLIAGRKVSEIAQTLALSVKTVSTHKTRVMEKLDASSTAGLVYYAMKHRLIEEDAEPDGTA
ncbi:MAG TPA: response regulator transcription factor [Burkholderiales bacterium]|nr:response regulator transcription factor [Burkholderiales bacterium]